eukprot:scaffold228090_cov55-Attheya_sp.AAC.2
MCAPARRITSPMHLTHRTGRPGHNCNVRVIVELGKASSYIEVRHMLSIALAIAPYPTSSY